MKRSFSVLIVLVLMVYLPPKKAEAQNTTFWMESQVHLAETETILQVNALMNHGFTDVFGVYVWTLTSEGWAEAVSGLTFSPRSWIAVSAGAGMEQHPNLWRLNSSLWIGGGGYSFLAIVETGASGFWYKSVLEFPLVLNVKVGGFAQQFKGISPHLAVQIPDTPLTVYLDGPLREKGRWNGVFLTLRTSF